MKTNRPCPNHRSLRGANFALSSSTKIAEHNMKFKFFFMMLIFLSCNNQNEENIDDESGFDRPILTSGFFEAPYKQIVQVGDTVKFHHNRNAVERHCMPNKRTLTHLKFVEERTIPPERACIGCYGSAVNIFVAISEGTETVWAAMIDSNEACDENNRDLVDYIVQIE